MWGEYSSQREQPVQRPDIRSVPPVLGEWGEIRVSGTE